MIMSFFCKESTAHFGIESGYDLLNLIPICVLEKAFQDRVRYLREQRVIELSLVGFQNYEFEQKVPKRWGLPSPPPG